MSNENKESKTQQNSSTLYWKDLNKSKFISLVTLSSWVIRTGIHPFILIKTRMQCVQDENQRYKSVFDAGKKIYQKEGLFKGWYRGYSAHFFGIVLAEPFYFLTLEVVREKVDRYWKKIGRPKGQREDLITSLIAGGIGAVVQQSILVPCDLTMQHLMLKNFHDTEGTNSKRSYYGLRDVIHSIYSKHGEGLRGFYKGYLITLCINVPLSSVLWAFYWQIQRTLEKILSRKYDFITAPVSAVLSAGMASLLTQPIDTLKTRLQVQKQQTSVKETFRTMIKQRKNVMRGLMSGTVPRALMVIPNCTVLISMYEYVKRVSAKDRDDSH